MGTKREITFDRGPRGECEIRLLKDGTIRVAASDGGVYDIEPDNALVPVVQAGHNFYFRLNKNETHLYDLRPYGTETENTFIVRHKWIPHGEDSVPESFNQPGREVVWRNPATNKVQKWWDPGGEMFNVEMEIVTGKYEGMTFKQTLLYCFKEDDDGNMMLSGKGKPARQTETYLTLAGYDWSHDVLPYSANILPALDAVLQDRTNIFQVKIAKGWVKEMFSAPEGMKV
jgi:hypothetical protein